MKKLFVFIIFIIIILSLSIFPIYQLIALNSVIIQNFKIKEFGMNNKLIFAVEGTGELYNPNMIPVTVKKIDYVGIIKDEEVFAGTIVGMIIPRGEAVQFSFAEEIDWVPDQVTVQEILLGKNVTLIISTEAQVSYLFFFTLHGEKKVEILITTLVKPYVEEQVAELSELLLTEFSRFKK